MQMGKSSYTQRCETRCTCVGCKKERGDQQRRRRIGYVVGVVGLVGVSTMIAWYSWQMYEKATAPKKPSAG